MIHYDNNKKNAFKKTWYIGDSCHIRSLWTDLDPSSVSEFIFFAATTFLNAIMLCGLVYGIVTKHKPAPQVICLHAASLSG